MTGQERGGLVGRGFPGLEPGQWVRHPVHGEWGWGQVQSAIGDRVTVNFEHAGKIMVNASQIALQVEDQRS